MGGHFGDRLCVACCVLVYEYFQYISNLHRSENKILRKTLEQQYKRGSFSLNLHF